MEAISLTNSSKTNKRRELDFYPTPPEVTRALMEFLRNIDGRTLNVWEPACGNGAMSKVIEEYGHHVYSSDIRDNSGYGIGGVDFLAEFNKFDAIITNPPFALSSDFIIHALDNADVVAMLLKSQYWHAAKRKDMFNHHPPAYVLPLTWRPDFMNGERGGAPTMEVAWTVWIAGNLDTRYRLLSKP